MHPETTLDMRTAALLLSLALLLGVFVAQQNVLAIDVDSVDYDLVEGVWPHRVLVVLPFGLS